MSNKDFNLEKWVAWIRWNSWQLLVGISLALIAFSAYAPDKGKPWPELSIAIIYGLTVIACIIATWLVELRWRKDKRLGRKLRWKWEQTPDTAPASLKTIELNKGTAHVKVNLRKANWHKLSDALDTEDGTALRGLRLDKSWGYPNFATWQIPANNSAKWRWLDLHYMPLGDPWSLPPWTKPANGSKVMIGYTTKGELWIDLDEIPHIAVRGGTGTGKGFFIRLLACEALRAGWLVLVLDGGMSGEHAAGDISPSYWRPMLVDMSEQQRIQAAIDALDEVIGITQMRASAGEILAREGIIADSRWTSFPAELKRAWPRIGIIADESTALLAPTGDRQVDRLRVILRSRLGSGVLRTGRKVGVHLLPLSDQTSTYTTALARGDTVQAEHVVILGNLDKGNIQAATDLQKLPKISGGVEKLAGFYLRRGNPNSVREIRIPPNSEKDLRNAALYTTGANT